MKSYGNHCNRFLACLALSTAPFTPAFAQFEISHTDGIADIKSSTTYIPMKDTNSDIAAKYKDVFRKYWKFSKIQFIKYDDLGKYITPTSSFFTMEKEVIKQTDEQFHWSDKFNEIYFELWLPDEKFFKI